MIASMKNLQCLKTTWEKMRNIGGEKTQKIQQLWLNSMHCVATSSDETYRQCIHTLIIHSYMVRGATYNRCHDYAASVI